MVGHWPKTVQKSATNGRSFHIYDPLKLYCMPRKCNVRTSCCMASQILLWPDKMSDSTALIVFNSLGNGSLLMTKVE